MSSQIGLSIFLLAITFSRSHVVLLFVCVFVLAISCSAKAHGIWSLSTCVHICALLQMWMTSVYWEHELHIEWKGKGKWRSNRFHSIPVPRFNANVQEAWALHEMHANCTMNSLIIFVHFWIKLITISYRIDLNWTDLYEQSPFFDIHIAWFGFDGNRVNEFDIALVKTDYNGYCTIWRELWHPENKCAGLSCMQLSLYTQCVHKHTNTTERLVRKSEWASQSLAVFLLLRIFKYIHRWSHMHRATKLCMRKSAMKLNNLNCEVDVPN